MKKLLTKNYSSQTKKGFTLIELLVVIAIIGILAVVVLVSLSSVRPKARDARRLADLDSYRTAFEIYYEDHGFYPSQKGTGSEDCDCANIQQLIGKDQVPALEARSDCFNDPPCGEFLKYIDPTPLDPSLGGRNSAEPKQWLIYRYRPQKVVTAGDPAGIVGKSYTIWATTERKHPNEGYKWEWADGAYGEYYYAIAGGETL